MINQRKGITPVIAIVLLLLITVGAVGVVYTQFQGIVEGGSGSGDLNKLQDADYSIVGATESSSQVTLRVRNTGESIYNLSSEASLEVARGGAYTDISSVPSTWTETSVDQNCLEQDQIGNNGRLQEGEDFTCNTSISFPNGGDTPVEFRYSVAGTVMDTKTCSVERDTAVVC